MAHEITAVTGETGKPRTYQLVAIDRLDEVKREVFPGIREIFVSS
jgi:hypothetical protein